jgi:hypothetical protein
MIRCLLDAYTDTHSRPRTGRSIQTRAKAARVG